MVLYLYDMAGCRAAASARTEASLRIRGEGGTCPLDAEIAGAEGEPMGKKGASTIPTVKPGQML